MAVCPLEAWKLPSGQAWQVFEAGSRNVPALHLRWVVVVDVTVVAVPVVMVVLVVVVLVVVVEMVVVEVPVLVTVVVTDVAVSVADVVVTVVVVQSPPTNDSALLSHCLHTRSEVVVASSAMYSPATHSVTGAHVRSRSPATGASTWYSCSAQVSLMVPHK